MLVIKLIINQKICLSIWSFVSKEWVPFEEFWSTYDLVTHGKLRGTHTRLAVWRALDIARDYMVSALLYMDGAEMGRELQLAISMTPTVSPL